MEKSSVVQERADERVEIPMIECVTNEEVMFVTCSPGCCSPMD